MSTIAHAIPLPRPLAALGARLDAWLAPPPPELAVEIAADRVVAGRAGGAVETRSLAPGLVTASALRPNLADPAAVAAVLRPLLERAGALEQAVTLLVPDLTARVSVLDFDTLPTRKDELEALARFRLRKSLPFAEDQAVIACQVLSSTRLLVAVADRVRLDEYENCLEAAGARAAIVLPSGLASLAARPMLDHQALLIRAESGCLTTAFCRHAVIEFFRAIELAAEPVFDDVFPSVAYFRDRVEAEGGGAAVLLAAGLPEALEARLREEAPWAQLQTEAVAPQLAVAGALRGRFS